MLDRTGRAQGYGRLALLTVMGLLFASLFTGCQLVSQIFGIGGVQLMITQITNGKTTTYTSGGTPFNFGPVDPNSTSGKSVSFTVENTGGSPVSITGVTANDAADYKFTPSATTVAPGASVTLKGVFTPQSDKTYPATVTISGSGSIASGTLTLPVTGQGNYPPVITFSVKVTASTGGAYNGTYVWDDSKQAFFNGSYYIYYVHGLNSDPPPANQWVLDTDLDPTNGVIDNSNFTYDELPPTGSGGNVWSGGKISALDDSAGGLYDTVNSAYDKAATQGDTVTIVPIANIQSDAESDAAGTPTYQWQINTGTTPSQGTWTDISGATSSSFQTESNSACTITAYPYYRLIVTPNATNGVAKGTATASPPLTLLAPC